MWFVRAFQRKELRRTFLWRVTAALVVSAASVVVTAMVLALRVPFSGYFNGTIEGACKMRPSADAALGLMFWHSSQIGVSRANSSVLIHEIRYPGDYPDRFQREELPTWTSAHKHWPDLPPNLSEVVASGATDIRLMKQADTGKRWSRLIQIEQAYGWPIRSHRLEVVQEVFVKKKANGEVRPTLAINQLKVGWVAPKWLGRLVGARGRLLMPTLLWVEATLCVLAHVLFWLVPFLGLLLLQWYLRSQRGQCLGCGYNVLDSGVGRCPECGLPA